MTTDSPPASAPAIADRLTDAARSSVEITLAASDAFRQWHRENFLLKEPTPGQLRDHDFAVRWLLRMNRVLLTVVADPTSPGHHLKPRLEAMVRLLETCWQTVHDPMPQAKADEIIGRTFPG
jgi:hypothetical protein